MKTFADNEGRTWLIAINVRAVKLCRALVDVDLYGLAGDGFAGLGRLLGNPVQFVDALFVLCQAQCKERGLSDEDFGAALGGDSLQRAADAFVEELIDFFPDPRVRTGLKKVMELSRTVQTKLLEEMETRAASVDADSIARQLIASSGSSPASLESIPNRSPSENSI